MLNKATAQVAALNKELHKGIERQIFGFVERHISHRKFKGTIF
jgi:hypothetical protein